MRSSKNINLIGFAGKMRTGKTHLSRLLKVKYGYKPYSFAFPLKNLCVFLMRDNGLTSIEQLNEWKNNNVEFSVKPDEKWYNCLLEELLCQVNDSEQLYYDIINAPEITNIRQLLQFVGTDIIRKYNVDWHVNIANMIIGNHVTGLNEKWTIDDVRFPNEVELIKKLGGDVYYISRPNTDLSSHSSENSITEEMFDEEHIIHNDRGLDELDDEALKTISLNYLL